MGITDSNSLFSHGISEENSDKEIDSREYNGIKLYEQFNNNIMDDCGIPPLYLTPMDIDDIH